MFCGDARAPRGISISGSRQSCDAGSDDNFAGASGDSSAAVLELEPEPLVERVASALEQRCGVRGGDLVRMSWDGLTAGLEIEWEHVVYLVAMHVLAGRSCRSRARVLCAQPSFCALSARNMRVLPWYHGAVAKF